jgi:putative IMPACT (imprinted ancient) family translation regulator
MLKPYSIPLNEIRLEHVVINSRFIATLMPVFSAEEARTFITRIKKEFVDASHNVPAYVIGGGNTVTISPTMANRLGQQAGLPWQFCAAVDSVMRPL